MLHDFIIAQRGAIIARCRSALAERLVPSATDSELELGVPLFLDQLTDALRRALDPNQTVAASAAQTGTEESASLQGMELQRQGFTVAQAVHTYGDICQAITQLASETGTSFTPREFQTLNYCLDVAIAEAVTQYGKLRDKEGARRLGRVGHDLRNLLHTAMLAFDTLKSGRIGVGGSTGAILGRSLIGLSALLHRDVAEARLGSGIRSHNEVLVRQLIEDVEVAAVLQAKAHGMQLVVKTIDRGVTVLADRSAVSNLLENAFKFTHAQGCVELRAHASADRVLIDVEDQCGGLPGDTAAQLTTALAGAAGGVGLGAGLALGVQRRKSTMAPFASSTSRDWVVSLPWICLAWWVQRRRPLLSGRLFVEASR